MRVSAIIPVRDGARYLAEVLGALAREGVDEVLVVDSGSRDGSVELAQAAGARVEQIDGSTFGHGRTRNLAASLATGDVLCFLTQDATPAVGWLDGIRAGFALGDDVGVVFGPHLPRPDTSPMIARELVEFFAGFEGPGAGPSVQRAGDGEPFLSNVNAAYRRACWSEVRFREIAYAEDQAFGRDALAAGWAKAYVPAAAVLHAHDFGTAEFARRYFDEYRGLRETAGHVEPFSVTGAARSTVRSVQGDLAWLRARGGGRGELVRWAPRSAAHHGGRRVFSALGSRADRVPPAVRARLSLEGRDDGAASGSAAPAVPPTERRHAWRTAHRLEPWAAVLRDGPAPLLPTDPSLASAPSLRVAVVIPPFQKGSGGHRTICTLVREFERMGHTCSLWLHDDLGLHAGQGDALLRRRVDRWFGPVAAPVHNGFEAWRGADVVVATGWQTVHSTLMLGDVHARAYLVQDHEPEFYPTSVDRSLAEDTYRHGLYVIAASPWLRDLVAERYGAAGTAFELGVDRSVYSPVPGVEREAGTVAFYARGATARRATSLGWLALSELKRRRPDVRVVAFGDSHASDEADFAFDDAGVVRPSALAALYSQATVGLVLSMTNYSLIPQEMLACGLPCVDLAGGCSEAVFGPDGPVVLSPFDPIAMADAIEHLLLDPAEWSRRSRDGLSAVAEQSWEHAAQAAEAGLRAALDGSCRLH